MKRALALWVGVLLALQQASLWPLWLLLTLLMCLIGLAWRWRATASQSSAHSVMVLVCWVVFGFVWCSLQGAWSMAQRIDADATPNPSEVVIEVLGLPQVFSDGTRFDARIVSANQQPSWQGKKVRLGWYVTKDDAPPVLPSGSQWRVSVRLRRPRGVLNPRGFDLEGYALRRGLAAVGSVQGHDFLAIQADGWGVDAVRQHLSHWFDVHLPSNQTRFIKALAIADTRGLSDDDWLLLRQTGITHLIAISGLHVGLVAMLGAWWVWLVYWLRPAWGLRLPRRQAQAVGAVLMAAFYTALTGFSLPTVRTTLMIAAALMVLGLRRGSNRFHAYAVAIVVMLLMDPLALLGAGFWLSFIGVGVLLLGLPSHKTKGWRQRMKQAGGGLIQAQWLMTWALFPLSLWFFGGMSLSGALLNLFAVPWVSFVVVPLVLLGLLSMPWPPLAVWFFTQAHALFDVLWRLMQWFSDHSWSYWVLPEASPWGMVLAALGMWVWLMPRFASCRWLGLFLLLPMFWPAPMVARQGEAVVTVVDVGQGLAVLVQTQHHALLYDTGAQLSARLDAGADMVVPTLQAAGVTHLDRIIISHGDGDHAGGLRGVQQSIPVDEVYGTANHQPSHKPCLAGQSWRWDGVVFDVLYPPRFLPYLGNASSCVLRVRTAGGSALFTGDVPKVVETRLLKEQSPSLRNDLVLMPHHGSKSSSSTGFIQHTQAQWAVASAGANNRFGHPHPSVMARWQAAGANIHRTDQDGAMRFRLSNKTTRLTRRMRVDHRRFWHEP